MIHYDSRRFYKEKIIKGSYKIMTIRVKNSTGVRLP